MRTYEESEKSKKTVSSMIEKKSNEKENQKTGNLQIFKAVLHSDTECFIVMFLILNHYNSAAVGDV